MTMTNECIRRADVLARLDAMRRRETETSIRDYLALHPRAAVDASCRTAMIAWLRQVQETLSLGPESVRVAASLLDRYLGSGDGMSLKVLESRRQFQLAAIACFYTAVKTTEPIVLGTDLLLQICRGTYKEGEIEAMENDVLAALGWRVATHTSMDVAAHLLELVSDRVGGNVREALMMVCRRHADHAMSDVNFLCRRPSDVGAACLASALSECNMIASPAEKRGIWARLSGLCDFNLASWEIAEAQHLLPSDVSPCKPIMGPKLSTSRQSRNVALSGGSPVCVTRTARQA